MRSSTFTYLNAGSYILAYLLKTNIIGVFSEALTANVQCIFTDQTVSVGAGAAEITNKQNKNLVFHSINILI